MDQTRQWAPKPVAEREREEFVERTRQLVTGEVSNDEFRQYRLERGVYGQRQPGVQMMRIKIPYGGLKPIQLKRIAEISARYGHNVAHLTTRQDIQLHYIDLLDIPAIMDMLAAVDLTTREACGNTVRNVTACPFAGVCREELFDVTPHANATASYLMRNPSTAGMGRKFKVSFSGCESRCGLVAIHDIGLIAATRTVDGQVQRGFTVLVGGGLGASPRAAQVLEEFVPEERLLPLCEAITRAFFLHGERARRMKARMKFLIDDIGVDEFRALVNRELGGITDAAPIPPLLPTQPVEPNGDATPAAEIDPRWIETNVYAQKQPGYCAVTVRLTLGDITAAKLSELADLAAEFTNDIRITVEQNLLLRSIHQSRLPSLYARLQALDLVEPGAGRLIDITACPGADTCNLGITSSKGLARQFTGQLEETLRRFADWDIRIKISGCPNSCGQHHIADLGFYGCSVKINGRVAPAFQMMLGGRTVGRNAAFAEPLLKVPSRRLPIVLETILAQFESNHVDGESFGQYVDRIGFEAFRKLLVPIAGADPSGNGEVFVDWGGHSAFVLNVKQGECAGVTVDLVDALLARALAHLDEAEAMHSSGRYQQATYTAFSGIIQAAKAVLVTESIHATSYHKIIGEFNRMVTQLPDTTMAFADFKARVEAFKQSAPGDNESRDYLDFARRVVDWVDNWNKTRITTAMTETAS